jgi:hypothetical protein
MVALISRQVTGKIADLRGQHAADREDTGEGEDHNTADRQPARHIPALQRLHQRRQDEAQIRWSG